MQVFTWIEEYWFLFLTSPFVIKVALAIITFNILLFIALSIVSAISYMIDTIQKNAYEKQRSEHKQFIKDTLNTNQVKTDGEIRLEFATECGKLNRATYYSLIPTLQEMVYENKDLQTSPNYQTLITALNIDNHLEKKLTFSSIENKLKVFQQLSKLKLVISDSKILPYTFSKNRHIRKGARNAYIGISNNNPFKFFDQEDNHINYWDQIILLEQLESHHKNNLPNFSNWLKYSKNNSQTIFIIKAAGYFKQYNTVNTLVQLLESEHHDIRMEAIKALGLMQVSYVEDKLIDIFPSQPAKCQDAVVEAIFNINSKNAIHFLKDAFEHSSQYESKKLIAEAIYLYEDDNHTVFNELLNNSKGFNSSILNHVKNPLNTKKLKIPTENNIVTLESRKDDDKWNALNVQPKF